MWQPKWRQEANEPDYRFSLANERTFLAWIRTALALLALLAGGMVLDQFATKLGPRGAALAVALFIAAWSGLREKRTAQCAFDLPERTNRAKPSALRDEIDRYTLQRGLDAQLFSASCWPAPRPRNASTRAIRLRQAVSTMTRPPARPPLRSPATCATSHGPIRA